MQNGMLEAIAAIDCRKSPPVNGALGRFVKLPDLISDS